jgi:hypothetical protein
MPEQSKPNCPYCGKTMSRWTTPPNSTWISEFQYVCFNDDCEYYIKGWEWMESKYNVRASYRCRIDSQSGKASPLPVWSPDALKDQIMPDDEPDKEKS